MSRRTIKAYCKYCKAKQKVNKKTVYCLYCGRIMWDDVEGIVLKPHKFKIWQHSDGRTEKWST